MNNSIPERLARFGVPEDTIIALDDAFSAESLPYAAILKARRTATYLASVRSVVTWQGEPLAYIADAAGIESEGDLESLRLALALRGDAPYLGLLDGGRLTVLRLGWDNSSIAEVTLTTFDDAAPDDALWAYSALSAGWEDSAATTKKQAERVEITDHIRSLLEGALHTLTNVEGGGLTPEDGLSLVGRALFLRFLADRGLLPDQFYQRRGALLSEPSQAQEVSDWLDATFNGDLLPLSAASVWSQLTRVARRALGDILEGTENSQLVLKWSEAWGSINLAHVPVGVLSQVYEGFVHRADPNKAKEHGVYYTPWRIAERMVGEAFAALRREGRAIDARVLDPAAGAGVFLHICFRQLVYERLREGQGITTASLRRLLTDQLQGFDLSEGALRFAALGLYLLAIELDPEPEPVEKLRFPHLRQTTLTRVSDATGGGPGSLGPSAGPEHEGRYDLVVGNPPWTTGAEEGWALIEKGVDAVVKARLGRGVVIPTRALELAFLWRSLGWVRPGGQIALALHGKLLHEQTRQMRQMRADLWDAASVTGVIDGARVRKSDVWGCTDQPFCLIFVKNSPPHVRSGCLVTAVEDEPRLNGEGRFRLSADASTWITPAEVREEPTLFKMLLRGTPMDRELMGRLRGVTTFGEYWRELQETYGAANMGAGQGIGEGGGKKLRVSKADGLPGLPSSSLHGLPLLSPDGATTLRVSLAGVTRFNAVDRPRVRWPRSPALWAPPQLIVRQSVLAKTSRLSAMVNLDEPLAFVQSFFGWSAAGHPLGALLVKVLALQLRSELALWTVLMRSGRFGVERERVEMGVIEDALIVRLEDMSPDQRAEAEALYERLAEEPDGAATWEALDRWAADLYGLSAAHLEIIHDTLAMELPFPKQRRAALLPAPLKMREAFVALVCERLNGWANIEGKTLTVEELPLPPRATWHMLSVVCPEVAADTAEEPRWRELLTMADAVDANEVVHPVAPGRLLIARRPPQRGWTRSRALLLARRVVHEHLDHLLGPDPV